MPAKKRHVEMSEVKHQAASIRVQVFYDRTEQRFHATYAGKSYQAKTEGEVRNQVYEAIEETLSVPWQPIIHVKPIVPYMHRMGQEHFVGFEIERLWMTKFPDGQYKQCQWDGQEKGYLLNWCKTFTWQEDRDGPFIPPTKRVWYSDTDYYLPYSEELWAKLEFMQTKIAELREQLMALFGSTEGLDLLLASSWLALPEHITTKKED